MCLLSAVTLFVVLRPCLDVANPFFLAFYEQTDLVAVVHFQGLSAVISSELALILTLL